MPAFIDLGQPPHGPRFGKWTVLRRDTDETRPGAWWVCVCDPKRGGCGVRKTVRGQLLRSGESTACRSCSGKGKRNRPLAYTVGDTVGLWTIRAYRPQDVAYLCECRCGSKAIIPVGNLRSGGSAACKVCSNLESPRGVAKPK